MRWASGEQLGLAPPTPNVFINERGQPFGRMGIGRMMERPVEAAGLSFRLHVHMLRHSTGYALRLFRGLLFAPH
jgi:site-specific recombinase XerD